MHLVGLLIYTLKTRLTYRLMCGFLFFFKCNCRLPVSLLSSVYKVILCGCHKGLLGRRFMSPFKLNLATSFYLGRLTQRETSGLLIEWEPLWVLERLCTLMEKRTMCCYCREYMPRHLGFSFMPTALLRL